MNSRPVAIESLMGERGRLRTSHELLQSAINLANRDASFIPFYLAVADYMAASMSRLEAQDIRLLDRIATKLGQPSAAETEIIAEVHRRLDGNRQHLQKLMTCRDALGAAPDDPGNVQNFEVISSNYISYIKQNMGHHAPSTDLARKLFNDADWLDIADLDPVYFDAEAKLYARLLDTCPDSVPLGTHAAAQIESRRSE